MFWAISCSSPGGKILLIQHLVSSLSVSDRPVHKLRKFFLNLCTGRSLNESDDTGCCTNTSWPHEDGQYIVQNMQRIVINVFKKNCAFSSSWSLAKVVHQSLGMWRKYQNYHLIQIEKWRQLFCLEFKFKTGLWNGTRLFISEMRKMSLMI